VSRTVDQYGEPLQASFFLFRADDPIGRGSLVPRGLGLEELPGFRIPTEFLFEQRRQFRRLSLFIGVDRGSVAIALRERGQAGGMHEPQLRKLIRPANVDGAPDTAQLPRSEADLVADGVNTFANAVDPAEAERTIDTFWPGDARTA